MIVINLNSSQMRLHIVLEFSFCTILST